MAEVTMTLNGRTYRLECDDGEEEHLLGLSEVVGDRLRNHQKQFGQVGDDRLLLMTALTIADELKETQKKLSAIEDDKDSTQDVVKAIEAKVAEKLETAAERIEMLSAALTERDAVASAD